MSLRRRIIKNESAFEDLGQLLIEACINYYNFEKMYSSSRLFQNAELSEYIQLFKDTDIKDLKDKYNAKKSTVSKNVYNLFLFSFAFIKHVDEMLAKDEYEKKYNELSYASLKDDKRLKGNELILIIGKRIWDEKRFTEGSYPFNYIRFMILSKQESSDFFKLKNNIERTQIFDADSAEVLVSHSDNDYKLLTKIEKELLYDNYGFDLEVNSELMSDGKVYASTKVNEDGYIYTGAKDKSVVCSQTTYNVIKRIIDYCSEQTKVIVFPELMIDITELDCVIKILNKSREKLSNVKIAIIGAYSNIAKEDKKEKYQDKSYDNYAVILHNSDGVWKLVAKYRKVIPSSMVMPLKTDINNNIKNNTITGDMPNKRVVMVENLNISNRNEEVVYIPCYDCVIGVAICRDVLDILNLDSPLHSYINCIDLLIVISLNQKDTNMFIGSAECLSRWHNCGVVYTNHIEGCDSDNELIEVSFALTPYKATKSGSTSLTGVVCYRSDLINPKKSDDGKMPIRYNIIEKEKIIAKYVLNREKRIEFDLFDNTYHLLGERSNGKILLYIKYENGDTWEKIIERYNYCLKKNSKGKVVFVKKYSMGISDEEFCILDVTHAPSDITTCTISVDEPFLPDNKYVVETL